MSDILDFQYKRSPFVFLQIYVDGVDVRHLDVSWLRRQLGVVSQEPGLFGGTVAENICVGKEEAERSEVLAAAKAADAHNFIVNLPQVQVFSGEATEATLKYVIV